MKVVVVAGVVALCLAASAGATAPPVVIDDGGQSSLCAGGNGVGAVAYIRTSRLGWGVGDYHYWQCVYSGDYNQSLVFDSYHNSYFKDPCYVWWIFWNNGCKQGSDYRDKYDVDYTWVYLG